MDIALIIVGSIIILTALIFLTSYVCFAITFLAPKKKRKITDELPLPPGEVYKPYLKQFENWMLEARALPQELVIIKSFDGLTLYGKLYVFSPDSPIEIMFHGYRGNAERDLCGGVQRAFALKRSVLIVDQRASGKSDGEVISFGINERKDCLKWIDFVIDKLGNDVKIILTGISMGASTVLMATEYDLPKNVVSVVADCGYSSIEKIIKKTIREMHLPAPVFYPLIKLGAKVFGKFDIDESSPVKALKKCRIPVIFAHGDCDSFVPVEMSRENYSACASEKELFIAKGAEHGLCYPTEPENYILALDEFYKRTSNRNN
jgi:fermentation-respiration switch protein FrsA (DUF1100 family)